MSRHRLRGVACGLVLGLLTWLALERPRASQRSSLQRSIAELRAGLERQPFRGLGESIRDLQRMERGFAQRVSLIERLKATPSCAREGLAALGHDDVARLELFSFGRSVVEVREMTGPARGAIDLGLDLRQVGVSLHRLSYDAGGFSLVGQPSCPPPRPQ